MRLAVRNVSANPSCEVNLVSLLGFIRKDMMLSPRLTRLRNALSAPVGTFAITSRISQSDRQKRHSC